MPVQRRFRRRQRPLKGFKTKTQVIAHNEAAKVTKRAMNNMIEKKRFDGLQNYMFTDIAGDIASVYTDPASSGLATGAGPQNVIGSVLKPYMLRIRYTFNIDPATPQQQTVRFTVVQVRGTWAVPGLGDIFQNTTDPSLSEYNQAFVAPTNGTARFKILYDRRHVLQFDESELVTRTIVIPGRKLRKGKFTGGVPVAFTDGNIYIVICNDTATGPARVKYYSSIFFTDA